MYLFSWEIISDFRLIKHFDQFLTLVTERITLKSLSAVLMSYRMLKNILIMSVVCKWDFITNPDTRNEKFSHIKLQLLSFNLSDRVFFMSFYYIMSSLPFSVLTGVIQNKDLLFIIRVNDLLKLIKSIRKKARFRNL
jgi:hypothetical protein